jgi:hypothetical protein
LLSNKNLINGQKIIKKIINRSPSILSANSTSFNFNSQHEGTNQYDNKGNLLISY